MVFFQDFLVLAGGLTIVPLMMVFISVYEPSFSANAMHIAVATSRQ
ncbi:hypothetical protein ACP8HZ_07050 [Francisella noatunensis]